jgi:hypothetical protein
MRTSTIFTLIFKSAFVVLLIYSSAQIYIKKVDWIFIQNANLIFHEAGHVIFSFFGDFIHVLGGTLGEFLVPLIVTVHFLLQKNLYGAGFGLWWTSTAFWSISVYSRDAQVQLLPLITGNSEDHDWTYLLGELGILNKDQVVGNVFFGISIFFFVCALVVFVIDAERTLKQIKPKSC